ncbi:polyphosphate kinase 2 [Methyloligella sp. 2.7D]|uniref:polyphosphate kinase 2 n=1 Tax=unclassified Methyloligella TaxID=2625955 RepID=UPI00157C4656|nr:polyphosphate kinase 2 [Methyloligella sp. GL2]QKP77716.1 polyphosphate kinase 2 [Methyloligella sp. GL2]
MDKKVNGDAAAHGDSPDDGEVREDVIEDVKRESHWHLRNGASEAPAEPEPPKKKKKAKKTKTKAKKKYRYIDELVKLQFELIRLQEWVQKEGLKVAVIFEGRDAAGKGGVIKRITESLNPRVCKIVALGTPTERERGQWYFQRYVPHLPAKGEIVLFDRSWYNRAGVERVMGFCSDEEYWEFLRACPLFEEMLVKSGTILLKYWFSVSDEEQEKRFKERIENPIKRWKLSPMDLKSRENWVEYSKAKDVMLHHTDTGVSPWYVVNADVKKKARLNCISHLLSMIDYEEVERPHIELTPRQPDPGYVRPPIDSQRWVPAIY